MSIKIWCSNCCGTGNVPHDAAHPEGHCHICFGIGYIVKGCENCRLQDVCDNQVELWDEENYVLIANGITFCTAWEKKDEQ